MKFYKFLDTIVGQETRLKALRFLAIRKENATIADIARGIRVAPPNVSKALRVLESEGAINGRRVGKSIEYSLNKGSYLVEKLLVPLLTAEKDAKYELGREIVKNIKFPFISVILFGSVARNDSHPKSDIDLLIVIDDKFDFSKAEDEALDLNEPISRYFGNMASPIIIKRSELIRKIKNDDKFIASVLKDGKVIGGKILSEII